MQIEEAKEYLKNYKYDNEVREAIETVLNELEKKDRQIEASNQEHKYDVEMIDEVKGEAVKLYKEIREKDKVIDLMAKEIDKEPNPDICKQMQGMECNNREILCTECIKQYFIKKASE